MNSDSPSISDLDGFVLAGSCDYDGATKRSQRRGGQLVVLGGKIVYSHGGRQVETWDISFLRQFTSRKIPTPKGLVVEILLIPIRGPASKIYCADSNDIVSETCRQVVAIVESAGDRNISGPSGECPTCWSGQSISGATLNPAAQVRCARCGAKATVQDWISQRLERRVHGQIVDLEGVSGLATGACTLKFTERSLSLVFPGGSQSIEVPYSSIKSLQFAGRGEHAVSSNFGIVGGGFGLQGAAQGIMEAEVANLLIQRLTSRQVVETLVGLEWSGGKVLLLNTVITPEVMASRLHPYVERIKQEATSADSSAPSSGEIDVMSDLKQLVAWRESGILDDQEFKVAKAKLLGS